MDRVRTFLGIEALSFWLASLVHAGILLGGYEHREAMIAEGVIGAVLALGLAVSLIDHRSTRVMGLAVQSFALLGTLVGIFMMVIGVGPGSRFDVAVHVMFITLLVPGLTFAAADAGRVITTHARGARL
jgi:hypothetical protein